MGKSNLQDGGWCTERKDPATLALRTVNGLPIHVYDCPVDEWVPRACERSMTTRPNLSSRLTITQSLSRQTTARRRSARSRSEARCKWTSRTRTASKLSLATCPPAYKTDPALIQRLTDGLELNTANYPDVGSGVCGYGTSGRNWLFGGVKGTAAKVCSPPPSPPPSPPRPVTVGNDPMMKVDGKFVKFSLPTGVLSPLLSWETLQNGKAASRWSCWA